jgi:hypothetical protein
MNYFEGKGGFAMGYYGSSEGNLTNTAAGPYLYLATFLFGGVMLIYTSIHNYTTEAEFAKTAVKTVATLESIVRTVYDSDGGSSYREVTITYDADGREYRANYRLYNFSMQPGDTFTVAYDPRKPTDVRSAAGPSTIMLIVCIPLSIVCFVSGVVGFLLMKRGQQA